MTLVGILVGVAGFLALPFLVPASAGAPRPTAVVRWLISLVCAWVLLFSVALTFRWNVLLVLLAVFAYVNGSIAVRALLLGSNANQPSLAAARLRQIPLQLHDPSWSPLLRIPFSLIESAYLVFVLPLRAAAEVLEIAANSDLQGSRTVIRALASTTTILALLFVLGIFQVRHNLHFLNVLSVFLLFFIPSVLVLTLEVLPGRPVFLSNAFVVFLGAAAAFLAGVLVIESFSPRLSAAVAANLDTLYEKVVSSMETGSAVYYTTSRPTLIRLCVDCKLEDDQMKSGDVRGAETIQSGVWMVAATEQGFVYDHVRVRPVNLARNNSPRAGFDSGRTYLAIQADLEIRSASEFPPLSTTVAPSTDQMKASPDPTLKQASSVRVQGVDSVEVFIAGTEEKPISTGLLLKPGEKVQVKYLRGRVVVDLPSNLSYPIWGNVSVQPGAGGLRIYSFSAVVGSRIIPFEIGHDRIELVNESNQEEEVQLFFNDPRPGQQHLEDRGNAAFIVSRQSQPVEAEQAAPPIGGERPAQVAKSYDDNTNAAALNSRLSEIREARSAKRYDEALILVRRLATDFPYTRSIQQLEDDIFEEKRQADNERAQAEFVRNTKTFQVYHRHVNMGADWSVYKTYCSGVLAIAPDGRMSYDCSGTNDPQGRCDHVTLYLRNSRVEFRNDGGIRITGPKSDHYDFYGAGSTVTDIRALLAARR